MVGFSQPMFDPYPSLRITIPGSIPISPTSTPSPPPFALMNSYHQWRGQFPNCDIKPFQKPNEYFFSYLQNNKMIPYHEPSINTPPIVYEAGIAHQMESKQPLNFSIESILQHNTNSSNKFSPGGSHVWSNYSVKHSQVCGNYNGNQRVDDRPNPPLKRVKTEPETTYSTPAISPLSSETDISKNDESDVNASLPNFCSKRENSIISRRSHLDEKPKRARTIFSPEQMKRLEFEFEKQQYMVGRERKYLAHLLNLGESQVKIWFQNRRIKWRKQNLDAQKARMTTLKDMASKNKAPQSDLASSSCRSV